MFTYLVIFLSFIGLLVVFSRRAYLVFLKKKVADEVGLAGDRDVISTGLAAAERREIAKKRIPRDRKSKMEKLYARALAQVKKCDPKGAVKTLVQALAIDPDYMDAQRELGRIYLEHKMWGKASAVYKYLSEKTGDPVDYSHLGLSSYNAGELEAAAEAYQKAISLDPDRAPRYVSLGQVYMDLEREQLALIAFNKALGLDPENVDYILLMADLYLRLGSLVEARDLALKAGVIAPMSKVAKRILKEVEEKEKAGEAGTTPQA